MASSLAGVCVCSRIYKRRCPVRRRSEQPGPLLFPNSLPSTIPVLHSVSFCENQSAGSGGSSVVASTTGASALTSSSSTETGMTVSLSSTWTKLPSVVVLGCEPFSLAGAAGLAVASDSGCSISVRSASEVESRGSLEVGGTLGGGQGGGVLSK